MIRFIAGRYEVLSLLGTSATSDVYEVRDRLGGELRALKILKTLKGEVWGGRLRAEFALLSELAHPSLPRVFDFGIAEGDRLFLVMERVPAAPFEAVVRASRDPSVLEEIAARAASALAHLDRAGLAHGDVKPANLLVVLGAGDPPGVADLRLADFGLALWHGASRDAALLEGTAEYLAPERFLGALPDARSDLYSLGLALVAFATGQPPRSGPLAEIAAARLSGTPPDIAAARPDLPAPLARAISGLLAREPNDRPASPAEFLREIGRPAEAAPPAVRSPAFVGREDALAALLAEARRAAETGARLLFVTGERGIGKSRLVSVAASRLLLDGYRVVRASATGSDDLRPLLSEEAPAEGEPRGLLLEEVASRPLETRRRSRFRAAARALGDLAGGGRLALVADDADALDPDALAFIAFLVERGDAPGPYLLLAADDAGAEALAPVLDTARAADRLASLSLAPLGADDAGRLVGSALGARRLPEDLLAEALEETGGNPQDLLSLLRALVAGGALVSGPEGWRYRRGAAAGVRRGAAAAAGTAVAGGGRGRAVAAPGLPGLGPLSADARALLADASILAHPFDLDLLRAIEPRADAVLARALREAVRAELLAEDAGEGGVWYSWRRASARELLAGSLEAGDRARLHAGALAALEARRRAGREVAEEDLAAHALGAGDAPRGRAFLREGARRAVAGLALARARRLLARLIDAGEDDPDAAGELARVATELGRFDEAIAACDRTLALLDRAQGEGSTAAGAGGSASARASLLRLKAWALAMSGREREAAPLLEEALARFPAAGPQGRGVAAPAHAAVLLDLAWILTKQGAYPAAADRVRAALRALPKDDRLRVIAWNRLAVVQLFLGRDAAAARLLGQALAAVEGTGTLEEASVLGNLAFAERRRGDHAAALDHRLRAEEIYRRLGQEVRLIDSAMERSLIERNLGRVADALRTVEWAIEENRALGRGAANGAFLISRGTLLERAGRWREAEAAFREALDLLEPQGDAANQVIAVYQLGELAVRRGDWAGAEEAYARGARIATDSGYRRGILGAPRNEGLLRLERGDPEGAIGPLADAAEALAAGPHAARAEALILLGAAQRDTGRLDDAAESFRRAARDLKARPDERLEGLLVREKARLLQRRGRAAEGLAEARRAVSLFGAAADQHETARSLVVLADLERAVGSRRRAREALREAGEIFARCGVARHQQAIESALAAAGSGDLDAAENFEAICRVMEAIAAIREPDRLLAVMLDLAIEHVGAERGFVVLYTGDGTGDHEVRAAREIAPAAAEELARVSRRILAAASAAEGAVASERAIDDPRFRDAPSVLTHNVLSVICAPLRITARTLGFIYVDNRRRASRFTPGDVRFIEAFAVQAAFALERAKEIRDLEWALRGAREDPTLVGRSPAIQRVLQLIDRAAPMDRLPVLITGESGTGKELVADLLHKRSPRRDRPFLKVNCAAFSETLIESELFGHERGAFTGAAFSRAGIFERANGGTLFLDEVGEIPEPVQIKLLRVLQELTLTRVGGTREIKVDVRLFSATNADLAGRMAARLFRPDVYYRLEGLKIHLPSLRERVADIPDLVRHFLDDHERVYGRDPLSITREALEILQAYPWPGNVRELEKEVHRALALALPHGNLIRKEDLSASLLAGEARPAEPARGASLRDEVERAEKEALVRALREAGWVNTRAAAILHCTEGAIRKKIRKYGIVKGL